MSVFHDLNLVYDPSKKSMKRLVSCSAMLGYDVVGIGHHCAVLDKKSPSSAPSLEFNDGDDRPQAKYLSRLTVNLSEGAHTLRSDDVQSYDILAIQPTNFKMFQTACNKLEIDVISVKMTEKVPYYFKTHPVSCAIERGIHFEIPYAPAIKDSTIRKYVICNAINLVRACRGRNIIISSWGNGPLDLRGPHDVINLGLLFGLTEAQARDAIQRNCRAVVMHAATRKSIRSSMDVQEISQIPESALWKIKASQVASGLVEDDEEIPTQQSGKSKKAKKRRRTSEGSGGGKVMKTQR